MTEITVNSERIDDVPLLVRQQQAMGIAEVIDNVIGRHGNHQGLSTGETMVGWLSYILSESDHRLSFVEAWADRLTHTLSQLLGCEVSGRDFTDDRLGDALRRLSDDAAWEAIERELCRRLIRIYQLPTKTARVDATTVALYHEHETSTLVAHGHSKDHRPDLGQIKMMMVTVDPLSLPATTLVVPGNRADDGLYLPAITAAQQTLATPGMLYVGDSKMEAQAIRLHLMGTSDYYLVPLSQKGEQGAVLTEQIASVLADETLELTPVYGTAKNDKEAPPLIAQGRESEREQEVILDGETVTWTERLLLIYSPTLAQSACQGLQQRLDRAETKLLALTPPSGRGKKQFKALAPLEVEIEQVLKQHRVNDYLRVTYQTEVKERQIRRYRDRPARTERKVRYQVLVTRDEAAIAAAYRTLGWRLYATNAPPERLSLADAVHIYRGSVPTIERTFARLKGRPLGLRPAFVHRDDHLIGLARLLSLALSLLTVTEYVVRRSLQHEKANLVGLYPGNPTRATDRPTTERLLGAFKDITLYIIAMPEQFTRQVSPLTPLQNRILQLLTFTDSIYTDLVLPRPNPP